MQEKQIKVINIRKEKVKLFYSHTAWSLQKTSYIRFVGNAKKHKITGRTNK